MIRDALMKSIRPRVEELAADLVDLIATRFEDQLAEAFEVARSALTSDMETACRTPPASIPATSDKSSSSPGSTSVVAASAPVFTVFDPPRSATGAVPSPTSSASSGSATSTVSRTASVVAPSSEPGKRAKIQCSKCGELGRRADTCGITHNLPTKPATTVVAAPTRRSIPAPASSPSPKPDRFAAIEEAALRRAEKEKRTPRDPDDDDRPRRDVEPDIASDVGLPEPTFSIDL